MKLRSIKNPVSEIGQPVPQGDLPGFLRKCHIRWEMPVPVNKIIHFRVGFQDFLRMNGQSGFNKIFILLTFSFFDEASKPALSRPEQGDTDPEVGMDPPEQPLIEPVLKNFLDEFV